MENYTTIQVNGRTHVLCDVDGRGHGANDYPYPNYRETGKALCGVIDKGETLEDWKRKRYSRVRENIKNELDKSNDE